MDLLDKKAILVSCFGWYEERLRYIERYLQTLGYTTSILLSDFNHIEKKYDLEFKDIRNIRYIHVLKYKKNISIIRLVSHWEFSKKIGKFLEKEKPALVYSLVPPNFLVKIIVKLKKKLGYKVVFDIIDLWPESFPKGNKKFFPFTIWKKIRDDWLNDADRIILECEYYKRSLKNLSLQKIKIVRLIREPITDMKKHEVFSEDVCLGYLGSINSLIDIERICDIVKIIRHSKSVLVRIVGDGEKKQQFIDGLEAAGATVKYYGKVFGDKELLFILGNCHFGINVYRKNVNIGLTAKSLNYFQIGIPILNSIPGDTEDMVKNYGIGVNIDDLDVETLNDFIEHTTEKKKQVNYVFMKEFSSDNIYSRIEFLKEL